MIPLVIVAKRNGPSSREDSPSRRLGRRQVVMVSPSCVEPAFGGEWHASVGDANRTPFTPCRGFACSASSVYDRHGGLVPRGTGLKAYARRLGTEQKAHRGERCAAVGGRTWSGGARSSIRTPPPFETMLRPPRRGVNPGENS